jgi:hypothetical protein
VRPVVTVSTSASRRSRISAVLLDDRLAESLDALGHAAGKAVQRGPLAKDGAEHVRVHGGDLAGVEMTDPALQLIRA